MVEKIQHKVQYVSVVPPQPVPVKKSKLHYVPDTIHTFIPKTLVPDSIANSDTTKVVLHEKNIRKYIPSPINRDNLPLSNVTIAVNRGHDCEYKKKGKKTHDVGAEVNFKGKHYREMDLNAIVANNTVRKLKLLGANVVEIEGKTVDQIKAIENQIKPDLFIAIHHDASNPGETGKGEIIFANSNRSKNAAKYILSRMKDDSTIKTFGINGMQKYVKKTDSMEDEEKVLAVLQANPEIPALLVEEGCMTDPKQMKHLINRKYQDKEAQILTDGIRDYFCGKKVKERDPKKHFYQTIFNPFRLETPKLPITKPADLKIGHDKDGDI